MDDTTATDPPITGPVKLPVTSDGRPKYDDATLTLIHRFLASVYTEFQGRKASLIRFAGDDIGHPLFSGQKLYFDHAMAAIKYAAWRATQAQMHLLTVTDADLERIKQQWEENSETCNVQGQSQQLPYSTIEREGSRTHGSESPNGQAENSATAHPKRSKRLSKGRKRR